MRIAISGKMKSGKTTLARALLQVGGEVWVKHSFADPIRFALSELGIYKNTDPELYRAGAQYIGTDLVRAYDPDWWVKRMSQAISGYVVDQGIVIDDVRFQNEYDWCKENGFMLVRLDISEQMQYNRGAEEGTFYHPSETGLDHIDKDEWDLWLPEESSIAQRVSAVLLNHSRLDHFSQIG